MKKLKFTFVGGDLHLAAAHFFIKESGYLSDTFLLEKAENIGKGDKCIVFPVSDIYVLPLPVTQDKSNINSPLSDLSLSFDDFFSMLPENATVFGGMIPEEIKTKAKKSGIRLYDYYDSEELQIKNAVPTAEGAIEIAIREMPVTLFGTKTLVIGSGRIGKVLSPILRAFGSRVTVAGRNHEALVWNEIYGFDTLNTALISESIKDYDLIINTAPSKIITKEVLSGLKKDALIIDLASRPGGVDMDAAAQLGIRVIWALGLPGKCAPVSAGRIIGSSVLNLLK
ncbi:MAG: dipicolinate synthase [Clostridia bacterium]|nr:dipicolinate synthase [Clostridia bacterium]